MAGERKNLPASVHQRLLDKAKASSRPFNELLQRFAIERFIYRLSRSPQADRFVLKGALMLAAWCGASSRPTMDIDLEGKTANDPDAIAAAVKAACTTVVEDDGMVFPPASVKATRIMVEAGYSGVRVRLRGSLGNARIALQIDVGFGDIVVPEPKTIAYPVLLDFPTPELKGYSKESTIAEKFHAMAQLGILNSRMKDFYDIWFLSRTFDFQGAVLSRAIAKTFANRGTPLPASPAVFDPSFANDREKTVQWRAFLGKSKLDDAPTPFAEVIAGLKRFIHPIATALHEQRRFHGAWKAPGPWR
jgi:hypothetical protein